jgi:hypothetical protein
MSSAATTKPHFLIVCQWNEFAGAPDGSPSYADSYNVTLSNDIEPTSLTECGHVRQGDAGCGGWGFFYLNLMRATVALARGAEAPDAAVVALVGPQPGDVVCACYDSLTSGAWEQCHCDVGRHGRQAVIG